MARGANGATTAWAWTFGVALAWAAVVVFVGVGMTTTYLIAYDGHVPVLLLQMQSLPVVTVGAALSALVLVSLPVPVPGHAQDGVAGNSPGAAGVFAALMVAAALNGWAASGEILRGLATSDIPTALLTAAAAFAGSLVRFDRPPNKGIEQTAEGRLTWELDRRS